jgi:hypothetical protein
MYTHSICHAFLSLIGIKLIYKAFSDFVSRKKMFWYALILLPTVSFWSGSILKESILIFAMGLTYFTISKLLVKFSLKYLFILIVSYAVLLINKPYAGLFVMALSFLWLFGSMFVWKTKILFLSIGGILTLFVLLIFVPSKLNLTDKVSYKQKDLNNLGIGGTFFINDSSFCSFEYELIDHFEMVDDTMIKCIESCEGEYKLFGKYEFNEFNIQKSEKLYHHYLTQIPSTSYYEVDLIKNSKKALIAFIPKAIFNVMVRPFPWDNGGKLKLFSFLQNVSLILFLLFCLFKRKLITNKEKWMISMLIISAFFIALLIGWTTPIFGAAVRYKMPVDLFLLIIGFILLKEKKNEKI